MSEPYLAIQVIMMPRDVNPHGTIFGGVLLSYIDQAGALGAIRAVVQAGGAPPSVVTVLRDWRMGTSQTWSFPSAPPPRSTWPSRLKATAWTLPSCR